LAGHPLIESEGVRALLKRLLYAYYLHDPTVGYCQGMNLIMALLYIIDASAEGRVLETGDKADEEGIFWLFDATSFSGLSRHIPRECPTGSYDD